MENEIILTAKTVEEAMADARERYGAPDKELSFTILEMPKKGFLGLGASPAKVKVTITRAMEDVDLSSLVADIRSMKTEDTPAPQKNQNHNGNKQNQNHKQNQNNQQKHQKPQNNGQNGQKPQNNNQNGQKPNQPKPQQNPQPKVQQNQQKPAEKPAAVSENDLPAALRKPAARPAAEKKPKEQKKQARPADNRPEAEKKKDLLSAVMGIKESEQAEKKPSAFETFGKKIEKAADKAEDKLESFGDKIEDAFEKIGDAVEEKWEETADSIEDKFARAMGSFTDRTEKAKKEKKEPEPPRLEFVTPAEMEFALDFANTLLKNMGLPARAEHNPDARGMEIPEGTVAARIEIKGDDSGILIGHHGETLDAIQYLVNLCASRKSESAKREFVKISVDIEGYREKREETLRALARRMAAKAVKNRRNVVLEPMNPYERRIIHSEVQGIENVSTHSVGSDENRKIVITYEGEDKIPSGRKRNDRRRRTGDRADKADRPGKAEKTEKPKAHDDRPRQKPVRAKSIDEIQLDLSGDSTATIGSLSQTSGEEENLREY